MSFRKYLKTILLLLLLLIIQFVYFDYRYASNYTELEANFISNINAINDTLQSLKMELNLVERRSFVNIHKITLPIVFCGDTLDYSNQLVREKIEREFFSLLGEQGQIQLYLKRSAKYFPIIEKSLQEAGLPDDLKYLAVHESALLPSIRSRANAVGLWQFIRQTGRLYKLKINRYIDERRDPEKATEAAMLMLKDLYNIFKSWPLVLASYNGGMGRVRSSIKKHNSESFIDLSLPEETERYYFKIIAVKIVLSEPEKFGFKLQEDDFFTPRDHNKISFTVSNSRMSLNEIAKVCGISISNLKNLNPQIRKSYLPRGVYTLHVPEHVYTKYLYDDEALEGRKFSNIHTIEDTRSAE
jgi:hypothetical protein